MALFDSQPRTLAILLLLLVLASLLALAGLSIASRFKRPPELRAGRLAPCPASPNCVSSEEPEPSRRVEPIALPPDPPDAFDALADLVAARPRTRVVERRAGYLRAEVRTPLLRFVDDLELLNDPRAGVAHVRSASRVGRSDLGANRRRVEALRRDFAQRLER